MGLKRPIKSFKAPKTCMCNNPQKEHIFGLFLGFQGRVQDSL